LVIPALLGRTVAGEPRTRPGPVMAKARRLAHELEERRALVGLVRVCPAEGVLIPPAQGTREALVSKQPGPFPIRIARAGDLGPNEDAYSPELGRSPFWERPSRALPDPERLPRRVRRVGPRQPPLSTKRTSGSHGRHGSRQRKTSPEDTDSHCAHHAGRLASAERVRMGRDGAKRGETLPNYNETRSAISNNVRKFALGIVTTRNHMSVNAQTDNRHARNHRTPTEPAGRTWRHCRRRLRRDRATHFARAARAAERSLRSRAPRD
jgi:hypothetical protein